MVDKTSSGISGVQIGPLRSSPRLLLVPFGDPLPELVLDDFADPGLVLVERPSQEAVGRHVAAPAVREPELDEAAVVRVALESRVTESDEVAHLAAGPLHRTDHELVLEVAGVALDQVLHPGQDDLSADQPGGLP